MQRRDAALRAMKGHPNSPRRARILIGVDLKAVRRERPPDNAEVRLEMHRVAEKRRRFRYRRIGVMLERVGMVKTEKKLCRIYREEGLSVSRRRVRKRARGSLTPMPVPLQPNQRRSLDFLSDTFGACSKFRILAVNDDWCRESLGLTAGTSIVGARVARALDALVRICGKPACMVSDKGAEFTLRDECLNDEIFDSLTDACRTLALWRYDYNNVRPHSSLGNKTPAEARRTLALLNGTAAGALARPEIDHHQTQGRSL